MERVGFGPRLGAILLDAVFIAIIGGILSIVFGATGLAAGAAMGGGEDADMMSGGLMGFIVGATLGMTVASILYNLVEALKGYSPGKYILGLQIGNADGTMANTNTYFIRYAVKNSSTLLGLLATITGIGFLSTLGGIAGFAIFIGCLMVLGANRLSIHDMVAKTAVYRRTELEKGEILNVNFD